MRTQVKTILDYLAPMVGDAGVCITTAAGKSQAIKQLDLTMWAMVKRAESDGVHWTWTVPVVDGCFAFPGDCKQARQIFVNGIPTTLRDQWFEGRLDFGRRDCGPSCHLEIRDIGDFTIPAPLPKIRPIRIALVAEFDSDAGKEVVCEVVNEYGERKKETLTLLAGQVPVLMESAAYDVSFFEKPLTDGPVKMYSTFDNSQRFFMALYGPQVRIGAFRRKKLPRRFWGCNLVQIVGKLRYYPITSENDIIPISDPMALRFGMQAISDQNKRDTAGYNEKLTFALNELNKEMEDGNAAAVVAPIQFMVGFGRGSQANNRKAWA